MTCATTDINIDNDFVACQEAISRDYYKKMCTQVIKILFYDVGHQQ